MKAKIPKMNQIPKFFVMTGSASRMSLASGFSMVQHSTIVD